MNVYARRVLLTGATGGIGHAIARALAARGARLVLSGRRADVLEPLAAEISAQTIVADLSDPSAPERLLAEAGEVDILIANAALPASGPLLEYTVEQLDRAIAVNLRAPAVLARLLAERLVERGEGHIVFVNSLNGKAAAGGAALYAATKFGLRGLAIGLREDLRGTGVGVSTVLPGFIREAGMFVEGGGLEALPPGVGTRSPEDVARGVIRAIERNRGEVAVAPVSLRIGATISSVMPGPALAIQRRLGGDAVASALGEHQRDKR